MASGRRTSRISSTSRRANIVIRSYGAPGRLVPPRATGLRSRAVVLRPDKVMDWHSTGAREELLLVIRGVLQLEIEGSAVKRILRRPLRAGQCAFLPSQTTHRVVNRSTQRALYIYITAAARPRQPS